MKVCEEIGSPVALDKTFWGSTSMTFLGFLIDSVKQLVMVPVDKVVKAQEMFDELLESKSRKATVIQIQTICGFLNF